ncbi:hypothetical protein [Enterococcus faecalis]|uniref:hypothetical protein n=1 Tax=Enterococcus faecalis TaxID=1351 RepID=UPI000CF265EC|nr:hypothetical protein [Enterococcus faecalis]EGO2528930.1 hypothetical protein [Enterococcus faecalis]EGO6635087.1 hypothetical protein [Enterococcus faecalis]EKB7622472.1 hypothetical protein [Enterococcus faecalis]EKE3390753.1 hypothetical protein [Enterococcus faecalis]PQF15352.1 hypothetical protein CUS86_00830 [Enterococcus faecalis]
MNGRRKKNMKIWIDDIEGYLQGYAMMEQPEAIEVEVDEDFSDFFNYRWDGKRLIYDPDNVPKPEPTPPTDIEVLQAENAELKQLNSKLMINDMNLKKELSEVTKKADNFAQISAKSMLAINQLTNQVKEINEKLAEGVE